MAAEILRRKLLILENDRTLRRELEGMFADLDVTAGETSDQALALVRRVEPDVVLFDLGAARQPAVAAQSLDLLRQILQLSPDTKIIAMTEHDARELAVAAVGLGAADFYYKPLDAGVLSIVVRRAFRIRELEEENGRLREKTGAMALEGIIGASDAMRALCRAVEKVAPTGATVLILGESGTGKELIANYIYKNSARESGPFVTINCASIPDTLIESELFGYEKGAFTDARTQKQGLAELANTGTLFLDEVGDISAVIQPKLLRFIQTGEFRRVGGNDVHRADVRILCATNKDLRMEVKEGRFREDLLYRLNVVTLVIPPLCERKEDIPLLVDNFLDWKFRRGVRKRVSPEAMEIGRASCRERV